jgi:hypothetical protein
MASNTIDQKDNFTICNNAWRSIIKKYGEYSKASDYDDREQVVVLVWVANGIIRNGGFEYLFSSNLPGDDDCEITIKAFEAIDCINCVKIFNDVKALFPNSKIPVDPEIRLKLFMKVPESSRDSLAVRFFDTNSEIEEKLTYYIGREIDR